MVRLSTDSNQEKKQSNTVAHLAHSASLKTKSRAVSFKDTALFVYKKGYRYDTLFLILRPYNPL
jgi:hypothetical protein